MERYAWNRLNTQQVGAFTEYFVKMEFTMYGFQVYGTEVDDRGIDFVARYEDGSYLAIQVKSLRPNPGGYVFMQNNKFELSPNTLLALGLLREAEEPVLYLIPSVVWTEPNAVFVERNYEGLKSKPEWGINVSKRNLPALEAFAFASTVQKLIDTVECRSHESQTGIEWQL